LQCVNPNLQFEAGKQNRGIVRISEKFCGKGFLAGCMS
jgi:hypothetical protein